VNALVTGANGFVGSHLVEALIAKGHRVTGLVRRTSDLRWLQGLDVEYVYGDVTDPASLSRAVAGIDDVFHVAGVIAAREKTAYHAVNAEGTRNVLQACVEAKESFRRIVCVTSLAAVGPSPTAVPLREDAKPHPLTSYGKSKYQAEQIAHQYMDRLPITVIRPPPIYGPRDQGVYTFFQWVKRGLIPTFRRHALISLCYIEDLVQGCIAATTHEKAIGQTYFICDPRIYTWEQVGDAIAAALGQPAVAIRIPAGLAYSVAWGAEITSKWRGRPPLLTREKVRELRQPYWICSPAKAQRELQFVSSVSLEHGINTTAAWYIEQGWL